MKTITYLLRLDPPLLERVRSEAKRRNKKVSELFRDIIGYGLQSLPPVPDTAAPVADAWEKLGPAPEVDYDKL